MSGRAFSRDLRVTACSCCRPGGVPGTPGDAAIAALPASLRLVVLLVEGYSYREVAGEVGVPVGTVRSRLYRGRRMLQESLIRHATDLGIRREGGR